MMNESRKSETHVLFHITNFSSLCDIHAPHFSQLLMDFASVMFEAVVDCCWEVELLNLNGFHRLIPQYLDELFLHIAVS